MSLVLREAYVENRVAWLLTKQTGLRFATVRNLLVNGWVYVQPEDAPPYWVHPVARLEEVK